MCGIWTHAVVYTSLEMKGVSIPLPWRHLEMASIWPVGKCSLINMYLVSKFTNPRSTFCHDPWIHATKLSKIFIFIKAFKNIMHQLLPVFGIKLPSPLTLPLLGVVSIPPTLRSAYSFSRTNKCKSASLVKLNRYPSKVKKVQTLLLIIPALVLSPRYSTYIDRIFSVQVR